MIPMKNKRTDRTGDKFFGMLFLIQVFQIYKVAKTTDCERRLSSYQTGDPNRAYKFEFL